jgi:hypothetical protein
LRELNYGRAAESELNRFTDLVKHARPAAHTALLSHDRLAGREQHGRGAVPQVVEADRRQPVASRSRRLGVARAASGPRRYAGPAWSPNRWLTQAGRNGVPSSFVNTRPESVQAGPQASRSSSCDLRQAARTGKDRTEALIAHMRRMISQFDDEADRADLEAAEQELAERRARKGGRPRRENQEP